MAAAGQATVFKLQTRVRDAWKAYASDAAAAFTIGWIADGQPLPPLGPKLASIVLQSDAFKTDSRAG